MNMSLDGGLRTLVQVLNDEQARVAAGEPACGADHHGQDDGVLCMRIADHATVGEANRESHANHVKDATADYWFTWINTANLAQPALG